MFDSFYGKKIFVTGASGFKGSWLVSLLIYLGATVKGYSLKPDTTFSHHSVLDNEYEHDYYDIRNVQRLKIAIKKFKPDLVFHLAAQPIVSFSYKMPEYTFETNTFGTLNLFEACKEVDSIQGLINITTDKVYKNLETSVAYKETDELEGHDPYSSSKVCSEHISICYRNLVKFPVVTVRAGNVVGGGDWALNRIVPDVIKSTLNNRKVVLRNPRSVRPWQYVLDILYGYLLVAKKIFNEEEVFNSYNFGSTDLVTVKEVVKLAQKYWDIIDYSESTNPPSFKETMILTLDSSLAKEHLKWNSKFSVEETIKNTILWYKEFYLKDNVITYKQIEDYLGVVHETI